MECSLSRLWTCAVFAGVMLASSPSAGRAGETVEVHGILEETTTGTILVTEASSYIVKGIDTSGLDGCRAIVLGDEGRDNGLEFIDAIEIKIAR